MNIPTLTPDGFSTAAHCGCTGCVKARAGRGERAPGRVVSFAVGPARVWRARTQTARARWEATLPGLESSFRSWQAAKEQHSEGVALALRYGLLPLSTEVTR